MNAVYRHPVCAPCRASLFTGEYSTSTGIVINEIRLNPAHYPRGFAHLPGESGSECACIGKRHMRANEPGNHRDPKNSFIPKGPHRLGFAGSFAACNFRHESSGAPAYHHLDAREKIYHDGFEPDCQTYMTFSQLERLRAQDWARPTIPVLGSVPPDCLARVINLEFRLPPNDLPENDPHADDWAKLSQAERAELTDRMRFGCAMVAISTTISEG